MKYIYLLTILFLVPITNGFGQSSFIHFNTNTIDSTTVSFYGDSLKVATLEARFSDEKAMINYNPAIPFNGIDDYLILTKPMPNISQVTIFTIFKSAVTDTLQGKAVWGVHSEESEIALTTKGAFTGNKFAYYTGGDSNRATLHTYTQMHRSKGDPVTDTYISIGATKKESLYPYFKGSVAEVIAYNRILRGTKRQFIETSLALKYGITLDNTKDYISSKKKVVWDRENDASYSYSIAGIGRDDETDLYQRQSTSSNAPGFLSIGVDTIAVSNNKNNAIINDLDFMVWGNNNQSLELELEESVTDRVPVLQRKWLIRPTGNSAKAMVTQLQLDASTLFDSIRPKEEYLLVIDQSGKGDFLPENVLYLPVTKISEKGILSFGTITWDEDSSGKDLFSFALKKDLGLTLTSQQPIICPNGSTNLDYLATGGIPPYTYNLVNNETAESQQWESSQDTEQNNSVSVTAAGNYTLTVTDVLGTQNQQEYTIILEDPLIVDLGADRQLKFEETLSLQAVISDEDRVVSYHWTSDDDAFTSTEQTVNIDTPGTYTLTIETVLGCQYSDEILIEESFIREFIIYPNPVTDGTYTISVVLAEKADINVTVYSILGIQVSSQELQAEDIYELNNKQRAHIKGRGLNTSGVYSVVLETPFEVASKNLIVE
jgi:predicted  nucleic acid-binding Zn-ribbon protein